MAETSWLKKSGVTPLKGAVVAVLALVLIVICVMQFSGPAPAPTPTDRSEARKTGPTTRARRPVPAATVNRPKLPKVTKSGQSSAWPKLSLGTIVQYDPFQLPQRVAARIRQQEETKKRAAARLKTINSQQAEEDTRRAQMLAELQKAGVELIITGRSRVVAIIDSRPVQVGDNINGLTVSEIRADGVVLTDKKLP